MQASRDELPISVLHEEVLWKVFLLNTDFGIYSTFESSPLTTARHCSHVRRQWRSIFLSSSVIWGRVVDIEDLGQKKSGWKKEVFTRSGEALLWVYARILSEAQRDFS
ncbi:hypothetical protein CPC08DRAFT_708686 [Agrocybe pediades]|nr:hypothetical protein CPC08DRAFT_708686 [Agrocybe pediades]